ncbi:hypothetical protein SLA2020_378350 [Shorea laevis]
MPQLCQRVKSRSLTELSQPEGGNHVADKCMLRYSNRAIFGVMESQPIRAFYNTGNVSDVEGFNQVLRPLLDKLRNRAASGNSTRKFAAESAAAPDFQTIYALVECTPDLDQLDCNNCLGTVAGYIHNVVMESREENM